MGEPIPSEKRRKAKLLDLPSEIRSRVLKRDARYELAAYLFIYEALGHTQKILRRNDPNLSAQERHVSGQELIEGVRQLAWDQFGPLAATVFRAWGVHRTEDLGEIVFNLVENDLLGKTESDRREDFAGGFDFETGFQGPLHLEPK